MGAEHLEFNETRRKLTWKESLYTTMAFFGVCILACVFAVAVVLIPSWIFGPTLGTGIVTAATLFLGAWFFIHNSATISYDTHEEEVQYDDTGDPL